MQNKELTRNEILEQLRAANEEIAKLKSKLATPIHSSQAPGGIDPTLAALCMACIRDRMSQSFLEDSEFEYVAKTFVPQAVRMAKMIQEEIAKQ